jgi:hypothetical protein
MSLWAPQQGDFDDWAKPSKQKFCVGHYGNAGSYGPPATTPMLPELEDTSVFIPFVRGDNLDASLEQFVPHPRQFRRAWQVHLPDPEPSFFAWEPIPPSDAFVALGMVITKTDEPPSLASVRCIHRCLCRPARAEPVFLWNDRGVACGSAGSLWAVNNLQCVWATNSYERPRGGSPGGGFWELKDWPLSLAEALCAHEETMRDEANRGACG